MRAANPMQPAVRNTVATAGCIGQGQRYVPILSDIVAELNGESLAGLKP